MRATALIVLAVALSAGRTAVAAPEVTGARIGQHKEVTRVVLEVTERLRFRLFILCNPYRVVLDLPNVGWRRGLELRPKRNGMVSDLRYGLFTSDTARVVLDVDRPVSVHKAFILEPEPGIDRYRLVVDLKAVAKKHVRCGAGAHHRSRAAWMRRRKPPANGAPKLGKGKRRVIAIDPGHGGIDPGTVGARGTKEKSITLAMAKALERVIRKTGRYRVVLTRRRDVYVPLRQRFATAKNAGAGLFISFHADSIRDRRTRGASVYTLSERASDKEAAALAAKENKADVIAGMDLNNESNDVANILIDLAQRETMNLSVRFAGLLVGELRRDVRLLRNTHRFAGFTVLKAPDVPSVLIELGYLSNRSDERLLRNRRHRDKVARRVLRAIEKYFAATEKLSRS